MVKRVEIALMVEGAGVEKVHGRMELSRKVQS